MSLKTMQHRNIFFRPPPFFPRPENMEILCKIDRLLDMEDFKIEDFPAKLTPYKPLGCYEEGSIKDDNQYHISFTCLSEVISNRECFIASFSTAIPVALSNFIEKNATEEFVFWFKKPDGIVTSFPWIFLCTNEVRDFLSRYIYQKPVLLTYFFFHRHSSFTIL